MTPRVEKTPEAEQDLVDIWLFIAQDSSTAADRFLEFLNEKCHLLARSPHIGRSRDELAPSLRSFPVGNYMVFYHPVPDGIEIVRVLSGYRDLEALF